MHSRRSQEVLEIVGEGIPKIRPRHFRNRRRLRGLGRLLLGPTTGNLLQPLGQVAIGDAGLLGPFVVFVPRQPESKAVPYGCSNQAFNVSLVTPVDDQVPCQIADELLELGEVGSGHRGAGGGLGRFRSGYAPGSGSGILVARH